MLPRHVALAVIVASVALGCLGSSMRSTAALAPGVTRADVKVDVRCQQSGALKIDINPWVTQLDQGDVTEWDLNARANTDSIVVRPKPTGWPYPDPVYRAYKGRKARADRMGPVSPGNNRFDYNIVAYCPGATAGTVDSVVIDPILIIRGG